MRILAIETSHDDTSVALYENKRIIREVSFTQTEFHKKFGGTVPEYAARGHYVNLLKALNEYISQDQLKNLDLIAYTAMPGLIGSLHMGTLFAHALGFALDVPTKPINHMHGHIFAAAFNNDIEFPAIALIVSGGHSQIWLVRSYLDMEILGETKDDAVGEVYDKVARKLNLGFPGGPVIDRMAKHGEEEFDFRLKDDKTYDMSFSGLKTKVINQINTMQQKKQFIFNENMCTSFQNAVIDILRRKMARAIEEYKPASIILGGGVSANSQLREEFDKWHHNAKIPHLRYTTDNAMMIAITADLEETHGN